MTLRRWIRHSRSIWISTVVTDVYKFAEEIGVATNEQSNGSTQIAQAAVRLNTATHEIESSVPEQAAGTQEVVKTMEQMGELVRHSSGSAAELAAAAEQMSNMAQNIKNVVGQFQLDSADQAPNQLARIAPAALRLPTPTSRSRCVTSRNRNLGCC